MKKQIFISYSSKEQKLAYEIKNVLENKGISCWMAPESIPAGSDYTKEIPTGIDEAIGLTLILSDAAQESPWVKDEVTRAISNGKKVIPFMSNKCDIKQDFGFMLSTVQRWEPYDKYEENLNKFAQFVHGIICAEESGKISESMYDNDIWMRINRFLENRIPYIKSNYLNTDPRFIGREEELHKIDQYMEENNILFVHGLGGIGKSELVKMYAQRFKIKYDVVIFMQYENGLKQDIDAIAIESLHNLPEKEGEKEEEYNKRKIKTWRSLLSDKTLLIIDNLDNPNEEDFDLVQKLNCKIIITSRVDFSEVSNQLTIAPFRDKEIIMQLFQQHYERTLSDSQKDTVFELLQYVDFHTMMVKLLALQMKNSEISPKKMLDAMKSNLTGAGEEIFKVAKDNKPIKDNAFGHLKRLFQIADLEEEKKRVLIDFSLLCNNKLKKDLFKRLADLKNYNTVNMLVELGWLQEDKEGFLSIHRLIKNLSLELLNENEEECNSIIGDVINAWDNSYLLVKSEDNKLKMTKKVLSRLCEIIARNLILTKQTFLSIINFYEKMIQVNDARNYKNIKEFSPEVIHKSVLIWISAMKQVHAEDVKTLIECYYSMGVSLLKKNYNESAIPVLEKTLEYCSKNFDAECVMKTYYLTVKIIGLAYYSAMQYGKALEYLEISLKAHCDGYKLTDELFTYTFAALFRCYYEMGVPMQKLDDMCKLLLTLEKQDSLEEIWISPLIDGIDSLGMYLIEKKQYERAEKAYQKLAEMVGVEWESRYIVPRIYGKLAHIYELQGDYQKEEFAILKGIRESERPLVEFGEPDSPDYEREGYCPIEDEKAGACIYNIAIAYYRKKGDNKRVEKYKVRLDEMLKTRSFEIDTYCEYANDPEAKEKEILKDWEMAMEWNYFIVTRQIMPWMLLTES